MAMLPDVARAAGCQSIVVVLGKGNFEYFLSKRLGVQRNPDKPNTAR